MKFLILFYVPGILLTAIIIQAFLSLVKIHIYNHNKECHPHIIENTSKPSQEKDMIERMRDVHLRPLPPVTPEEQEKGLAETAAANAASFMSGKNT